MRGNFSGKIKGTQVEAQEPRQVGRKMEIVTKSLAFFLWLHAFTFVILTGLSIWHTGINLH
jgi:hypothetical protein